MASRVSVIIPAFNRAEMLRQALASVLSQTRPPDEVIVVDDGSTDDTPAMLATFGERLTVLHQPNRGVSAARNAGLGCATGDLIAFLDSDDLLDPTSIEKRAAHLEAHPEVGAVYTDTLLINAVGTRQGRFSARRPDATPTGTIFATLCRFNVFQIGAAMVRRECLDGVRFDPSLALAEDQDFWLRVAARCTFAYLDEPLIHYRTHPTMTTHTLGEHIHRAILEVRHRAMGMQAFRALPSLEKARIYAAHAFDYALCDEIGPARRWLWQALRTDPRYVKGYAFLGLSLLGAGSLLRATTGVQRLNTGVAS